jgi:chemotaxis methyl-accepting protein methylase
MNPPFLDLIVTIMIDIHQKDISMYHEDYLKKIICKRMEKLNIVDDRVYTNLLTDSKQEAINLGKAIKNHFSIFFRDNELFAALNLKILPKIIEAKEANHLSEIRIWSMACANGQEAYSMAMLMDENLKKKESDLQYRIFATDIDSICIDNACRGLYSKDNLQQITLARFENYFFCEKSQYRIIPSVRQHVCFSCYDLLDPLTITPPDCIYGHFDIIMCCNVLYYYKPCYQKVIVGKIIRSLSEGGCVVTDRTEKDIIQQYANMQTAIVDYPVFTID